MTQYVSRKEVVRGLVNIEDCVDGSILELEEYIKKIKERSITVANNSISNISTDRKTTKSRKQKKGRKITEWIFQATNR